MNRSFDSVQVLVYGNWRVVSIGLRHLLNELGFINVVKCDHFGEIHSHLSDPSKRFDMLLVDFNGDFLEVLRKINATRQLPQGKRLKIVAFADKKEQGPFYLASGVDRVLTKQADAPELKEALKAMLRESPIG